MKQPDLATVAHVKRSYVQGMPALPLRQHLPPSTCTRTVAVGDTAAEQHALPLSQDAVDATVLCTPKCTGQAPGSEPPDSVGSVSITTGSGMGIGHAPGAANLSIRTDYEKYRLMQQSVGLRLTHGKSRIHGTGVFARVDHRAGDWLIEYSGAHLARLLSSCPVL